MATQTPNFSALLDFTPCAPCLQRNRGAIPSVRVVGATPMCSECFSGGKQQEETPESIREWICGVNGQLRRLAAQVSLQTGKINRMVALLDKQTVAEAPLCPSIFTVRQIVASYFGETEAGRRPSAMRLQHVAMYLCRELGYGLSEIGRAFHRDHSSVGYACTKLARREAWDPQTKQLLTHFRNLLKDKKA